MPPSWEMAAARAAWLCGPRTPCDSAMLASTAAAPWAAGASERRSSWLGAAGTDVGGAGAAWLLLGGAAGAGACPVAHESNGLLLLLPALAPTEDDEAAALLTAWGAGAGAADPNSNSLDGTARGTGGGACLPAGVPNETVGASIVEKAADAGGGRDGGAAAGAAAGAAGPKTSNSPAAKAGGGGAFAGAAEGGAEEAEGANQPPAELDAGIAVAWAPAPCRREGKDG